MLKNGVVQANCSAIQVQVVVVLAAQLLMLLLLRVSGNSKKVACTNTFDTFSAVSAIVLMYIKSLKRGGYDVWLTMLYR